MFDSSNVYDFEFSKPEANDKDDKDDNPSVVP